MNHFKKQLANELVITLIIVGTLVGGIFFFKNSIDTYATSIALGRTRLVQLSSDILDLSNLQAQYSQAAQYLNAFNAVIPSYYNLINLNKDLQSLAAAQNLSYSFSFAGENPKTNNGFGSISFTLSVASPSFNNLLSFLNSLERFKYLTAIDGVGFNTQTDGTLTMAVRGRVFYK